MKKILLCFFMIFIFIITTVRISAHDLWLLPQEFRISPGKSQIIYVNTGMDFPKSLSAVTPDRIEKFIMIGKSGEKNLTDLEVQENSLIAKCAFSNPGSFVIAASLKPREIKLTAEEFNEYLLHDGLTDVYNLRKKEGILDKDAIEHYSKFPKTIIQVGNQLDDTPTKPVNLTLEILPIVNPYGLRLGESFELKVLFKGHPLSNAELAWSYPGQGEHFAGSVRTDTDGKAAIPLTKAGPYVVRLIHMEWVAKPTHEWESYWTSLTFEVLPE